MARQAVGRLAGRDGQRSSGEDVPVTGVRAGVLAAALERQRHPLPELAHPADLPRGDPGHQREGLHVAVHEEARLAVFEWIEVWYQRTRVQGSLGYVSPEAFEAAARAG